MSFPLILSFKVIFSVMLLIKAKKPIYFSNLCFHTNSASSIKKAFLINFAKFTGKHLCRNLFFFFDKVARQETPTRVFSYENIIFKNTFFKEHLRATAPSSIPTKILKLLQVQISKNLTDIFSL